MKIHRFFFYLTLLLLPAQLGYHIWPDWTLVLGRRVDYLSPTLYLTDCMIFATILFWLPEIRFPKIHKKTVVGLLGIMLFIGLNIAVSYIPVIALIKWLKIFELMSWYFYIRMTKPSFAASLTVCSYAILYSSVLALGQLFLQRSAGGIFWLLGERTFSVQTLGIARVDMTPYGFLMPRWISLPSIEIVRPYATFSHPNVLGGFLAALLPIFAWHRVHKILTPPGKKVFLWIIWILGSLTLFATFGRTGWIAYGISMLYVLACLLTDRHAFFRKRRMLFCTFIVLGITIAVTIAFPYLKTLSQDTESVRVRSDLLSSAMILWKTSPAVGVGLGNFLIHLPRYYPSRALLFIQPVHSVYVLIGAELGYIGLTLFVLMIWNHVIVRIRHHAKQHTCSRYITLLPLCTLLGIGIFDHYPVTLQQGQLLLTLFLAWTTYKTEV